MFELPLKSKLQRSLGADGGETLKGVARSTIRTLLEAQELGSGSNDLRKVSPSGRKLAKPGLVVVGGAAGLTAASAAVSAIRRRDSDG